MENGKAYVKDGFLYLKINLAKNCGPSSTGASIIIAKNEGQFEALTCDGAEGLGIKFIVVKKKAKKKAIVVDDDEEEEPVKPKSKKKVRK